MNPNRLLITSSSGYRMEKEKGKWERERERRQGLFFLSLSLLYSEFLGNGWAVTIQHHSPPSETTASASFSLFISLHFSSFAFPLL